MQICFVHDLVKTILYTFHRVMTNSASQFTASIRHSSRTVNNRKWGDPIHLLP